MDNFLKQSLHDLFQLINSGLIWKKTFTGVTGQLLPDGTLDPDPTDGLDPGLIWVRQTFDTTGETSRAAIPAIRGMINSSVANTPVICGYSRWGGRLIAIMPNFSEETVATYGDQLSGLGIPPISPQNQTTPIPTNLLQGGRVLLNTGTPTPGLSVYVEPDPEQNWPGGYLPIASGDLPTSANQFRWAVFYNEGGTPAYVLTSPVVRPNVASFVTGNSQDAVNAQIPAGAIRYGCVTLAYAQTDLTPATTITRNDLREFFNVEGALLSGDSEAQTITTGTITTGNKSVIVVSPSSGTTDTLSTITLTGAPRELWLIAAAGDTITLATGGNIAVGAVCTDTQAVLIYHNGTTAYVVSGGGGGDATTVTYTPTTPADWPSVPTDVQEALDTLAAENVTGGINKDLFTQTADVTVANTTTPTTLLGTGQGSSLLPANYFVVGRTLVIDAAGYRATALVAPNITFEVDLGSATICLTATFADVGSLSGQQWHLHAEITCRTTGGSGSVSAQGWVELNSTSTVAIRAEMATTSPVTLDTTVSQQAKALVTWGTASASNTITATEARLQTVDPNAGAGSGGGAMVLLASGKVSGSPASSISLTSIPQTSKHLLLIVHARSTLSAVQDAFLIQLNGDSTAGDYFGTELGSTGTNVGGIENIGGSATIALADMCAASAPSGAFGGLILDLYDYTNTTKLKTGNFRNDWTTALAHNGLDQRTGQGTLNSTAAITRIDILAAGGNLDVGTEYELYGMG